MKDPRSRRRISIWAIAFLLVVFAGTLFAAPTKPGAEKAQKAESSQYVGTETCKSCHADQFKTIDSTVHFRLNGKGEDFHGCESCHGPGAAHVEAGGDKTKIFTFKGASAEQQSEHCLECHAKAHDQAGFERTAHARAGVSCTTCHSPHHATERQALLTQKQPDLCYSCHKDSQADFMKPFHHKVNEGLVTCSSCHNVHNANEMKQERRTADGQEACYKCHADKRGPFVFEHYPVKSEGCSACHTPHGSTNPRLLTRSRVNTLCLECHQNFYNSPHPQNTKSQACTFCHVAVHGSNTSNVLFK